jgi:hypothetical protein
MVLIDCPEMSVNNYQFKMCNIPEECRSNVHFGDSLTTRIIDINWVSSKCRVCLNIQSQKNGRWSKANERFRSAQNEVPSVDICPHRKSLAWARIMWRAWKIYQCGVHVVTRACKDGCSIWSMLVAAVSFSTAMHDFPYRWRKNVAGRLNMRRLLPRMPLGWPSQRAL